MSGAAKLPHGVVVLGVVSLLMDVSSEMIHSALPLFLTGALGASVLAVGFIEGVAEATASITKLFAGAASDALGSRKPFALAGYALAALTKPLFAIAPSVGAVLFARFADRIGKGMRGAPRDALIADLTPAAQRGAAYGLRQALDTVGALLGPAAALALLAASAGDFRLVFWVAVAPAFASVAVLTLAVREPERTRGPEPLRSPLRRESLARLSRRYWGVVAFAALLTAARLSEAFLVLRAGDAGVGAQLAPGALLAMNAVYALSAYPLGRVSDRARRQLAYAGVGVLGAALAALALAKGPGVALAGAALYGLHMGATQGLLAALVAGEAPDELRGTALGLFHLVVGVAQLVAASAAGAAWDALGPRFVFGLGAACALLALAGLLVAPSSANAVRGETRSARPE
jgi:MFS family permease